MDIAKRMIKEWGEEDDSLLHGVRTDYVMKSRTGLKLCT